MAARPLILDGTTLARVISAQGYRLALWLGCWGLTAVAWGADPYVEAIQREAAKLDQIAVPAARRGDQPAAASSSTTSSAAPGSLASAELEQFEREFDARYHGSYLFYRKLPARSREEVFQEYLKGTSMEDLRRIIMDRFLHSQR